MKKIEQYSNFVYSITITRTESLMDNVQTFSTDISINCLLNFCLIVSDECGDWRILHLGGKIFGI